MNRREAIAATLAAGTLAAPRLARAQHGFPERPIRIIVPVAPGGGVDTFSRLIAAKIETQRHVQFVVENRTGGNSTVGGLDVHRAAPDGYTLLCHASTHNVARLVMRDVPYDPLTGFTPIALAGQAPLIHIIAKNRPEKTVKEIVAAVKARPDAWSFATAQLGAPGHLAEVAFNQFTGLNVPIVVYRGTAPAANDVAGGHVPMMIEAVIALLPMVKGGLVRAVAVTGNKHSKLAPAVPTWRSLACRSLISAPGGRFGARQAWPSAWSARSTAGSTMRSGPLPPTGGSTLSASNRPRKRPRRSRNSCVPITIAVPSF